MNNTLTNFQEKIPLDSIDIGDRVRQDFGDIDELARSISELGLIQPLVINRENKLIAGQRRLKALRRLGATELTHSITFVYNDELDPLRLKAMEVEENVRRKNLTWQEEVLAKKRLLEIMQELHGEPSGGRPRKTDIVGETSPGFGINKLAALLGESNAQTSRDIELAQMIETAPQLAKMDTKEAARRMLQLATAVAVSKAQRIDSKPGDLISNDATLIIGDFNVESPNHIADSSVDFVICDPPYGEDSEGMGPQSPQLLSKAFEDSRDATIELYKSLAKESFRVLRQDSFAMFFFGPRLYGHIIMACLSAGLDVDMVPLIWVKNNVINSSPYLRYSRSYEPILVARKGQPRLMRPSQRDVLQFDSVQLRSQEEKKFYHAQKPVALIEKLILDTTVEDEMIVDFTAGSGTTGVAALKNKRKCILFEIDKTACEIIKTRVQGVQVK
jgi:DNA modification methylase